MRFFLIIVLAGVLNGCSLFGSYTWSHPQKTAATQRADRAECLALSSIVFGSPEDLLNLAKQGTQGPNRGVEADCLAEKGYKKVFVRTNRSGAT